MSLKRAITQLKEASDQLLLDRMRRGDLNAARHLLNREWGAMIDDIYNAPDLYAAEVERVIASAPDHVAAQYRAAWALFPAVIEADRVGDEARGMALAAQIDSVFDELSEWQGGRMWTKLLDFYSANRPGFKLADEDLFSIGQLLLQERTK